MQDIPITFSCPMGQTKVNVTFLVSNKRIFFLLMIKKINQLQIINKLMSGIPILLFFFLTVVLYQNTRLMVAQTLPIRRYLRVAHASRLCTLREINGLIATRTISGVKRLEFYYLIPVLKHVKFRKKVTSGVGPVSHSFALQL